MWSLIEEESSRKALQVPMQEMRGSLLYRLPKGTFGLIKLLFIFS